MVQSPIYSTQPDIVDVHIYPQVETMSNTKDMIQQEAAVDYSDLVHFLNAAGLASAAIVIGETFGGTLSPVFLPPDPNNPNDHGSYCWLGDYASPQGTPEANVAGFNASSLSSFTVTFRPWMNVPGQCFGYGSGPGIAGNYQSINYYLMGPYSPTNR